MSALAAVRSERDQPFGFSEAVEEAEIGCVAIALCNPERIDEASLKPEEFYSPQIEKAWGAILDLHGVGAAIDPVTVVARLEAKGCHAISVATLSAFVVRGFYREKMADYAEIVRKASITRRAAMALSETLHKAKSGELADSELLDEGMRALAAVDVGDSAIGESMPTISGRAMREYLEASAAHGRGELVAPGVATGIRELDTYIGGLRRGMVTIVAARPRMGKSTLALGFADSITAEGIGVHVFSLEDTASSYHDRAVARLSGVSPQALRQGTASRHDIEKTLAAAEVIRKRRNWFVDDRAGLSAEDVIRCVRRKRRELGTEVVIVDYISKLKRPRAASTHDAMAMIANTLADAARQDGLVYVVLSQLNRECEKRDNKRPLLNDLRESGSLEESARCVLCLYRDSIYNPNANPNQIEILVRKNSHGESDGTITANWSGAGFRIW